MEQLYFCTRWGSESLSWADFAEEVKDAGYDGIETSLPENPAEQEELINNLLKFDLKLIGVHWDTVTADFCRHKEEMEQRLRALTAIKPLFITSHTGKDHFSFEQNVELLSLAQEIGLSEGTEVFHETHRGKFSFAAHLTAPYLEQLPWLKLTLDISHWYAVAESYLADQDKALAMALSRTAHIHSRIGFTQGPQVPDPRNPEWQEALNHHLLCWDKVFKLRETEGAEQFTVTPEFGPFPYMALQIMPEAAALHQWDVNHYMKDLLKNRYQALPILETVQKHT
jgi:hypothetical protein